MENSTNVTVEAIRGRTIPPDPFKLYNLTLAMGNILIFIGAILYSFISWYKIAAWRRYRNYIFLQTILALVLINVSYIGCYNHWPCCNIIMNLCHDLSMAGVANWTLIICMVIYTKILKVFSGDVQNKYIKANIFAWGLAIVEHAVSVHHFQDPLISILCMTHSMSFVVLGFYFSVLYALIKLTTMRTVSKDNSIQILKIFLYVTSAMAILFLMQAKEYYYEYREQYFFAIFVSEQIYIFSFLSMKAHRELWREYFKTEDGQKSVLRSII